MVKKFYSGSYQCLWVLLVVLCLGLVDETKANVQINQLNSAQLWQKVEFQLTGVPPGFNPFDQASIRVDANLSIPTNGNMTIPAFWYQDYLRSTNSSGAEVDAANGSPQWRVRFTPPVAGAYAMSIYVLTNGQLCATSEVASFTVPATNLPGRYGYAVVATNGMYFQTQDGRALPLNGENVCWAGSAGTYDYDTWFTSMQNAGENYARLWMCPWNFALEQTAGSLTNYTLSPAWQLDYVLQQAEQKGVYVQLCLDYHGMFEVVPDYWGGNNYWTNNPYNSINGGPCVNQNEFFTNAVAKTLYQNRLRYLIARYGYSQNLLGWEFFNEIDNVFTYLDTNAVTAWHSLMGGWLHTNDPFGHLVTTSVSTATAGPAIFGVSQLDFLSWHFYFNGLSDPASKLAAQATTYGKAYGKPVMIGEYGTDWKKWDYSGDPYLRGFRQGIWGAALGGSVGTAMSWWWQNIASSNAYPVYASLSSILGGTDWGRGSWTTIGFKTSGAMPVVVGDLLPDGVPFNVQLPLNSASSSNFVGKLAVVNSQVNNYSAAVLDSYIQGTRRANLKTPFQLSAWFTNDASLVMHLNSVASGVNLVVRVDGSQVLSTNIPNRDGRSSVNGEYNTNILVNIPSGKHLIEITNAGTDWLYLDWVQLNQVLPAAYSNNWQALQTAIGLRGDRESLLYVVTPGVAWPSGATNASLPLQHSQIITLTNWPTGDYITAWYSPASGDSVASSQVVASNGNLILTLPDFTEDLAGILLPLPTGTLNGDATICNGNTSVSVIQDFEGFADSSALNAVIINSTANTTLTIGAANGVNGSRALIFQGANGSSPYYSQFTLPVSSFSLTGVQSVTLAMKFISGSSENLKIELLDASGTPIIQGPQVLTQTIMNASFANYTIGVTNLSSTVAGIRFSYGGSDYGATTVAFDDISVLINQASATIQTTLGGSAGPWKVTWSDGVTQTNNTSPATRSVNPTTTTTYTATIQDAVTSITNSASGSATVTVNVIPPTPTAGNNGPVCAGSALALNTPAVPGAIYIWTGPNSFLSTNQNPTISSSATVGMSGTYYVAVTVNGCTSAAGSTAVTVNPTAVGGVASPASAQVYSGTATNITLSGQTGAIVKWQSSTNDGTNWSDIASTANPFLTENLTQTTIFRAVVQSGDCSTATSSLVTVIVSAMVAPMLTGVQMVNATTIQLTFSGPAGQTYKVCETSDLTLPLLIWDVMTNGTFGLSPEIFTDASATNIARFYRITSP
ncbi:MAG: DUF5060 domain-containing protein [Verrucomicrobiota bacterium]